MTATVRMRACPLCDRALGPDERARILPDRHLAHASCTDARCSVCGIVCRPDERDGSGRCGVCAP